jgi:cysteate synthase
MEPKYRIRCVGGGELIGDLTSLSCPHAHDSLLRTEYADRSLHLAPHPGIFRYLSWLPVNEPLVPSGGPVTFTSHELSREIGLSRLDLSFSGYFPEMGARLTSCSFKELEALPTMQRFRELGGGIPVVASAGNTGRAFAEVSARCMRPVVIVVPERAVPRLWTTEPAQDVFLVAVSGDYSDAIAVSGVLAAAPGCVPEGGARNVARRDGMGTVMLDAVVTAGRMPGHYFQAVGSGTGGIAAWEASQRLCGDGHYGPTPPCLHLAQNEPFTPMVSAWRGRRREILPSIDMPDAREAETRVMSDVLTNRNPPYGIRGGVYDALQGTGGNMYAVSNTDGTRAMKLVLDTVGIDLDPAAAIATAALVQAVEGGFVARTDHILLNLSGGGYERVREDLDMYPIEVSARVRHDGDPGNILRLLEGWMTHHG